MAFYGTKKLSMGMGGLHQNRLTVAAESFPSIFILLSSFSSYQIFQRSLSYLLSLYMVSPISSFWKMAPGSSQHKKIL